MPYQGSALQISHLKAPKGHKGHKLFSEFFCYFCSLRPFGPFGPLTILKKTSLNFSNRVD
jgi:hypothetical protein